MYWKIYNNLIFAAFQSIIAPQRACGYYGTYIEAFSYGYIILPVSGDEDMFYSNKPINSNSEDQLNRKGFAKLLANTLVNLDSKDTFTVGLFGKWGCGKTSLVNMTLSEIDNIQKNVEEDEKIIVVHFEPWNFTDTNQLLTQFFVRLANEFQKKGDKSLTKIGKNLEKYADAFSLLEYIPGVGATIASVSKWGASWLGRKMQKVLYLRRKKKEAVMNY